MNNIVGMFVRWWFTLFGIIMFILQIPRLTNIVDWLPVGIITFIVFGTIASVVLTTIEWDNEK